MQADGWAELGIGLGAAVDRAPLGLGVIAATGRYVVVNPALARLVGLTPAELLGTEAVGWLLPEDRGRGRLLLQQLLVGGVQEVSDELRYHGAQGDRVLARISAASLPGPDGRVAGVVVQLEDITAERKAEQAQAELASLVAVLDEAVLTLDDSGCIRTWNAAAERLLGWSADDVLGRDVTLLSPDDGHNGPDALQTFAAGETVRGQGRCRRRDGTVVPVELTGTRIEDPEGALVAGIGVLRDLREQQQAAQRLEHLARHDPLTGLPNRREFEERLERALTQAQASGKALGVLFLDLDRFKEVNDQHGHLVGDEYLRVVGARLSGAIRPADCLARWGGDEYAVLVGGAATDEDVESVADRLLETLQRPVHIRTLVLPAAASIGVATSSDGRAPEDVLRTADEAMYAAKTGGGNRWVHRDRRSGKDPDEPC